MLDYLVTSRVRRQLLRLLWAEGVEASASDLSRRTGAGFSAVHRELEKMRVAGLASGERVGRRVVYRAVHAHPRASLIRELVDADRGGDAPKRSPEDDRLRGWLRALGAPIGAAARGGRRPALEEIVAAGVALAHRDATVARVLPIVLWKQRGRLDYGRLAREATRRHERHALGFFLELTGELGDEPTLHGAARTLRDRRRRRARLFFDRPHGPLELALAREKTPRRARRWGYLMNMGHDSFASAFAKHRGGPA